MEADGRPLSSRFLPCIGSRRMRQQPPPLPLPLLPAPAASPSTQLLACVRWPRTPTFGIFEEEERRGSLNRSACSQSASVWRSIGLSAARGQGLMHADDGNVSAALRRYREADILRSLSQDRAHTNIVRFHDAYSSPTTLFVLMHAEMGGDLMARCEAGGGTLPEAEACAYVAGIAAALRHLHKLRIVHRDLKASNVLLSAPGCESAAHRGYPIAKLADFGLAASLRPPHHRLRHPFLARARDHSMRPRRGRGARRWRLRHCGRPLVARLAAALVAARLASV